MNHEEFQKILKKYKQGLSSPEEEILLEAWFRAMESSEPPSLTPADKANIKQRSWNRVQNHILRAGQNERGAIVQRRPGRLFSGTAWAIAATLLIVIVSTIFLLVKTSPASRVVSPAAVAETTVSNDTERAMEVQLSDGSQVRLAPKSRLSYPEPFDNTQRLITLEGEAFFSVSRDASRPFLVNTREVITKVLGTSFTVSAFPDADNITVSVVTGKVSVLTKHDHDADDAELDETILTPNQKIIYNKNNHLVSRSLVEEPVRILPDEVVERMHFEAAPIREIFEGLEQVYGVDIAFDEATFSSCILTTSIAEGSIYNRLEMICKAIDAQYKILEDQIMITGSGCN